jgi:hypothetical protein
MHELSRAQCEFAEHHRIVFPFIISISTFPMEAGFVSYQNQFCGYHQLCIWGPGRLCGQALIIRKLSNGFSELEPDIDFRRREIEF